MTTLTGPAATGRRLPGPPASATPKLLWLLMRDRLGLMNLAAGDSVVALARNAESLAEGDPETLESDEESGLDPSAEEADPS